MSKVWASMLGKSEAEAERLISKLEAKAGYDSVDVRLLAEHKQQLRAKIAALHLDPDDTTSEELYNALLAKFQNDEAALDKALGVSGVSASKKLDAALTLSRHVADTAEVWALKAPVLRALLKKNAPKKTMKILGYRSVDSMLKRVDPGEILYVAGKAESASWHKVWDKSLAKLPSSSCELREPKIIIAKSDLAEKEIVVAEKTSGTLLVNADLINENHGSLSITLALLHSLEKISVRGQLKSLARVNPALRWWSDTEHLLSIHEDKVVSLNIKDVAAAQAGEASIEHGAGVLWNKLVDAYKEKVDELPEEVAQLETEVADGIDKLNAPVRELAVETVEA